MSENKIKIMSKEADSLADLIKAVEEYGYEVLEVKTTKLFDDSISIRLSLSKETSK